MGEASPRGARDASATGALLREDTADNKDSYRFGGKYHVDDVMDVPGPGAIAIKTPFSAGVRVADRLDAPNEPARTVNYTCNGGSAVEQYTITLATNVHPLAVPRDVKIDGPNLTYQATYHLDGTVTVVRQIEERTTGSVCTPEDQATAQPFYAKAFKDLRAQVVYVDAFQDASATDRAIGMRLTRGCP